MLFSGPPELQNHVAEIIASEIGLDLYKIDLSSVVSNTSAKRKKPGKNLC